MKESFTNLTLGQLYTSREIKELIIEQNLSPDNPMAFTYNRWNKGMSKVQAFFEYKGSGEYKYVGGELISRYNGKVVHNPKDSFEYLIAEWNNGTCKFLEPSLKNFKDWKASKYEGERMASLNNKLHLKFNGEEKRYIIKLNAEKNEIENGYKVISSSSKLGKLLLGKKAGDSFYFGQFFVEIIAIL